MWKREHYRFAVDHLDSETVARYDDPQVASLLGNAGIIRYRQKVLATINYAWRLLEVQETFGSLLGAHGEGQSIFRFV